jgi:hypothetical protein
MCPVAQADGHDAPGLVDELVPRRTAVIEDVLVGAEDPVREPVLAQELPDVLDRVQLRRFGGERHERDVGRDQQPLRLMPTRLVEQDDRVSAGRDGLRNLVEVQAHRLGGAAGKDQTGALAFSRADRPEDVGGLGSQVAWCAGPCAPSGPAASDFVLLPDPGLVAKPELNELAACLLGDRCQTGGELFLKADTAASLLA